MRLRFAFNFLACTATAGHGYAERDDVPLVQKTWRTRHEDLSSDAGRVQQAALPKLQAMVQQLPFNIPEGMSVQNLVLFTSSVFQAFRNESYAAVVRESISNLSRDFSPFLGAVRNSIAALQRSSASGPTEEQALEALEEFWRSNEDAWAIYLSKVAGCMITISLRQPNEVRALEKAWTPLLSSSNLSSFGSFGALNPSSFGAFSVSAAAFSNYRANEVFLDKRTVCPKVKAFWPQVASFEPRLLREVIPALADKGSVKGFQAMVEAFAPDVSDRVTGILDASMEAALDVARLWQPVLHDGVAAVEAHAEGHMACKLPRTKQQAAVHAGSTCPRLGALASLAGAVATWWALGV